MSKCRACKTVNDESAAFCETCGAPLTGRSRIPMGPVTWGVLVALVLAAGSGGWIWWNWRGPGSYTASRPSASRTTGDSPVATALQLSREGWPGKAPAVVIVAADDAVAAAVANPLATSVGGPVLLTGVDALDGAVGDRIRELAPARVYVVGAQGRLATATVDAIGALGVPVQRFGGPDDHTVANAVARAIGRSSDTGGVALARADDPSALAAVAAYAGPLGVPVLLADETGRVRIEAATGKALSPGVALLVATQEQVPGAALRIPALGGRPVDRVTGATPQELSAKLAEYAFAHGFEYTTVYAVRDAERDHSFAAGAFIAQVARQTASAPTPLIITADATLGDTAVTFLTRHASAISQLRFLGPGGQAAAQAEKVALAAAETRISKRAVVVGGQLGQSLVSYDKTRLVFSATPDVLSRVKRGAVLVGDKTPAAPKGFIVRVLSVTRQGDQLVVTAEQGSLSDIVVKGSLDARLTPRQGDTVSSGTSPIDAQAAALMIGSGGRPGTVMTDAGGYVRTAGTGKAILDLPSMTINLPELNISGKTGDGASVRLSAAYKESWKSSIILSASWDWFKVTRFALESVTIHTRGFTAQVEGSLTLSQKNDPAKFYKVLPVPKFKPTVGGWFTIGVVPVYAECYIEPVGLFSATLTGTLRYDYRTQDSSTKGLEFVAGRKQQWQWIDEKGEPSATWNMSLGGSIGFKISGGAKFGASLYDSFGPFIKADLYEKLTFEAKRLLQFGSAGLILPIADAGEGGSIVAGLEASVGGELKVPIIDTNISTIEMDVLDVSYPIWEWGAKLDKADDEPGGTPISTPVKDGTRNTLDVMLVIDRSGSMGDEDKSGVQKIENARSAAQAVVDVMSEPGSGGDASRVGIVSFSGGVVDNQPLTTDYQVLSRTLRDIAPNDSTNVEAGLNAAINHLEQGKAARRIIILVSDGMPNTGESTLEGLTSSGLRVVSRCISDKIPVYAVGYGTDASGAELLRSIAQRTQGEAYLEDSAQSVSNTLASRLVVIAETASGGTVISKQDVSLLRGSPAKLAGFDVAPSQTGDAVDVRVMVGTRDRNTDIWLIDPDGREVANGSYEGAQVAEGRALRRFRVSSAKAGSYSLYATAPSTATIAAATAVTDAEDGSDSQGSQGDALQVTDANGAPISDHVGAFVVVSKTAASGSARQAENAAVAPRGVVPVWFWAAFATIGAVLCGWFVGTLVAVARR